MQEKITKDDLAGHIPVEKLNVCEEDGIDIEFKSKHKSDDDLSPKNIAASLAGAGFELAVQYIPQEEKEIINITGRRRDGSSKESEGSHPLVGYKMDHWLEDYDVDIPPFKAGEESITAFSNHPNADPVEIETGNIITKTELATDELTCLLVLNINNRTLATYELTEKCAPKIGRYNSISIESVEEMLTQRGDDIYADDAKLFK